MIILLNAKARACAICFIVLFIIMSLSLKAQPIVSLSSSGPCTGDTLTVLSNLPDSQIIWKLNGVPVDTATRKLLTYGTTVATNSPVIYASVDTARNVFVSSLIVGPPDTYYIKKWVSGANSGTVLTSSTTNFFSGIYVDKNDTVYIAAYNQNNSSILKLAPGASTPVLVAGGNGIGSSANQFNAPTGVFVDNNRNIYVADKNNNRIQKWTPGASSGITVAGGNGAGEADSQLYFPRQVFVDGSGNIFVSDFANNRVQKWGTAAISGTTVAGDHYGNAGSAANQLDGPEGLYVDTNGNIIIADMYNNRIQKWAPGATSGTTILGGNGQGSAANQFYYPNNCLPDKNGNLYVGDGGNSRVQRFADTVLPYYVTNAAGHYTASVTATNSVGSATTVADTVTNYEFAGVTIISLYNNLICLAYDTAQLFAHTSFGGTAPTYDWYKNGTYLSTTTDSSIRIPGVSNADSFLCVMNSNFTCLYPPDFALSNHIVITVDSSTITQTASITASPGNTIQYGQNVTFHVTTTFGGAGYQWYKNTNIIAGATDSVYNSSTLVDGDQITCISESNLPCVWNKDVVSNIIVMRVALAVGQLSNTIRDIRLFPNPNNGVFTLSGNIDPSFNGTDVSIQLLDMPGKILQEEHASLQHGEFIRQIQLDPSLTNGVYLLRISAGEASRVLRFVMER